jgi:hypothetical protein
MTTFTFPGAIFYAQIEHGSASVNDIIPNRGQGISRMQSTMSSSTA